MYGEHSIRAAYRPYAERAHRGRSQAVGDLWNGAVTGGARLSRRILADLRRWHERRKNVRDLSALDDRLLKDIGIGRSEILYVVQEGARLSIPDGAYQTRAERLRADTIARHPSLPRGGVRAAHPIARSGRNAGTGPTTRDGERCGSDPRPRQFPPIPQPNVLGRRARQAR